jgi:hypothetical protein
MSFPAFLLAGDKRFPSKLVKTSTNPFKIRPFHASSNFAQVLPARCTQKESKASCLFTLEGTVQISDESKACDKDGTHT